MCSKYSIKVSKRLGNVSPRDRIDGDGVNNSNTGLTHCYLTVGRRGLNLWGSHLSSLEHVTLIRLLNLESRKSCYIQYIASSWTIDMKSSPLVCTANQTAWQTWLFNGFPSNKNGGIRHVRWLFAVYMEGLRMLFDQRSRNANNMSNVRDTIWPDICRSRHRRFHNNWPY